LSHGTCIRNGVNGNASIDGRGERNRKKLRSTDLVNPFITYRQVLESNNWKEN